MLTQLLLFLYVGTHIMTMPFERGICLTSYMLLRYASEALRPCITRESIDVPEKYLEYPVAILYTT